MKTTYFKENPLGQETIKNIQGLASLSEETARSILDWLEARESYPVLDRAEMVQIADATGMSATTLRGPVSVVRLFINRIAEYNENVEAFYADLKDLKIVKDETGYKTLDLIFSRLPTMIEKFRRLQSCAVTENAGMPNLVASNITTAIKPVFAKRFEYGKDSIEQYRPKPIAYCVVAQIELKNDSESIFAFQLNRENFDRFLNELLSLQAELRILEVKAQEMNSDLCEK